MLAIPGTEGYFQWCRQLSPGPIQLSTPMNHQFTCPTCGFAMQASFEGGSAAAQCPQCGQEFMVEASPPVLPVVKAQAVPVATPHPVQPRPAHRPPPGRPGPVPQPRAQARIESHHPNPSPGRDRLRIVGLVVAGVLLLIGVVWLTRQPGEPKAAVVTGPTPEETARQEAAAAQAKMSLELKKIKDALAASEAAKAKREEELARETSQQEQAARDAEQAKEQAKHAQLVSYYAETFFAGDKEAAEAFVKVRTSCLFELADLTNDGDPTNDPKTKEEGEKFLLKRIIWHLERDSVLSKWMKDHGRDPNKLGPELAQIAPQRPGSGQPANSFDFTKYASMGSGFWVASAGWILTNEHVVTDAQTVDLRLPDGKMLQAKVVKTDEANDLALLKADLTTASWLAVSKGDTDLQLGRTVFTVGYPDPVVQGVEPKFTDGRISAASGIGDRKDSYQTTVPVQHGNSGGALVDFATGWVIGVINAKLESRTGVSADNVSYAIKGRVVRTFLDSVPEAKAAVDANPPKALEHSDERSVIDRTTQSAVLILRRR